MSRIRMIHLTSKLVFNIDFLAHWSGKTFSATKPINRSIAEGRKVRQLSLTVLMFMTGVNDQYRVNIMPCMLYTVI